MLSYDVIASTNPAMIEIVYNGALTGGAGTFSSVNSSSLVEYNTDCTGISGGYVLDSGFVVTGAGTVRGSLQQMIFSKLGLALSKDGTIQDTVSIVVTSLTGTSNVNAAISWKEIY